MTLYYKIPEGYYVRFVEAPIRSKDNGRYLNKTIILFILEKIRYLPEVFYGFFDGVAARIL